jgi:hypothetical protein
MLSDDIVRSSLGVNEFIFFQLCDQILVSIGRVEGAMLTATCIMLTSVQRCFFLGIYMCVHYQVM